MGDQLRKPDFDTGVIKLGIAEDEIHSALFDNRSDRTCCNAAVADAIPALDRRLADICLRQEFADLLDVGENGVPIRHSHNRRDQLCRAQSAL